MSYIIPRSNVRQVANLFFEQVKANPKYQIMVKNIYKSKSSHALTNLLRLMAQDKKYRANINYIRKKRAAAAFLLTAKRKNITVKEKSKFGSLLLVAAVLKHSH